MQLPSVMKKREKKYYKPSEVKYMQDRFIHVIARTIDESINYKHCTC